MGLLGFQIRPVSGPGIVDVRALNGPKPVQNPFKVVGHEAPHHFEWVFGQVSGRLDPEHRRFPVQKPAGFENPTIPFPDLPNALPMGIQLHRGSKVHRFFRRRPDPKALLDRLPYVPQPCQANEENFAFGAYEFCAPSCCPGGGCPWSPVTPGTPDGVLPGVGGSLLCALTCDQGQGCPRGMSCATKCCPRGVAPPGVLLKDPGVLLKDSGVL